MIEGTRWLKWMALVVVVLAIRIFPNLLETYQEAIVGLVGGLIWYYHSRPRVIAHLRVSGRSLPIIDIENIGNRPAKSVIVELLPKDFAPDGSDRTNREEPIGDMPPGYTREITVPKNWYSVFTEDLDEQKEGRKDWEITVRSKAWWKFSHKDSFVFSLGTGTVMSDRMLDDWKKMNDHLEKISKSTANIGKHVEQVAILERERISGNVLYLRVGKLFRSLSGPYFVPLLDGERAKELIEGAKSAMCPNGTSAPDAIPDCKHSEEIVRRLSAFGGRNAFRWGVDDRGHGEAVP